MKRIILFTALFTICQIIQAQVTTSSISGRVKSEKETLIGATIKATHTPTGTVYGVISRVDGTYTLPNMRIGGPYTVEVSYVGFNTETFREIYLTLGEDFILNATLAEGSLTLDAVEITARQSAVMNSNRTGAQEVINRESMDKLPALNRSLSDFTRLSPMNNNNNFGGVSHRYNNTTVDGATFSNGFGTGGASVETISLEALEQVQVMIAPYDVRNGGFTGAGINSVTKSGSNDFHASAYTYFKGPALQGYRIKDEIQTVSEFSNRQYGASASGAILKNKLFYYVNAELDRLETPIYYTTENSAADAGQLQDLADFLQTELGYNPGAFDKTKRETHGDRLTLRLDYNINSNNALSVKYYYLKSFATNNPSTSGTPLNGRGPNEYAIPFSSAFYRGNYNSNIVIADLNTKVSDKMSNYLKVGFSRIRDFRDMDGGFFPQVDILDGGATPNAMTTFGTEGYSYNNQINTDVWQLQDNFVIDLGKHQVTFGTQSDFRSISNGFAQNYPGAWRFNSINDFKFNVLATKQYLQTHGNLNGFNMHNFNPEDFGFASTVTGVNGANYVQRYALGNEFPFSKVDVLQLGFYAQDKWRISDHLNITVGLRVDVPIFTTNLPQNEKVAAETYRDGIKVDVSQYPNAKPLISPRLGFNYKPFDDASLQIRGGTGIFTGLPPYVWICNQMGNNGLSFGDLNVSGENLATLGFTGNIDALKPSETAATRSDINGIDPDFKYPNLWKTNLAVDYRFGDGWVATGEFLFSKDINAIYHDNIGIQMTDKFINDGGDGATRPFYLSGTGKWFSDLEGNQGAANNVVYLRNARKGYAIFGTLQLQKNFSDGALKGLYVNGSYTMGKAMSLTDGSSSQAFSAWQYRPALDPNSQELSYNAGSIDGRVLLSAFYTANWSKNAATNIGFVYQRYRPFRYSYTYNGDANGDGSRTNDLIYIPRSLDEISKNLDAGAFGSQAEAWAALDAFIEQDPYLSKHRGEYAERNGAVAPWANQLDFSLYHDIKIYQKNNRYHTLRFSFDIQNVLNLVNKNWGVQQTVATGSQQFQLLSIPEGKNPSAENDYTLTYTISPQTAETFKDNISNVSRWVAVFGIKYTF